ncbi:class I SAM-dependent methyltransferase, partial [Methylobacterium sp. BTF04]|uniref:class I SAM-dependent methyltransferase n=1 Tax=Methylobacterium sp. BTF04 TaxID=2708300 RepID=UPI0013D5E71C
MQKRVAHSVGLGDGLFFDRLDKACRHLNNFRDGPDQGGLPSRAVEIGTGWFPIVPIALWLCGVGTVETYDLSRHATDTRLSQTIEHFIIAWKNGRLARALPDLDRDRISRLKRMAQNRIPSELVEGLAELGIHYAIAPIGPERIPRGSVDLVFSTAVLEYLPYPALVGLLRECCDSLSPKGVVSHWVDLSDEYAYFDRDITPFNFLRFSDRAWRLINNPIIPLSRLRLDEYRRACKGRTNFRPLRRSKTRPVAAGCLNDEGARSGPFIVRRRP